MSFKPHQNDNVLQPWEYYPAAAGTYEVGQMLQMSNGQLAALTAATKTTPPYVCMARTTVAAGEVLPVIRVQKDMIFETQLSAEAASAAVGSMLEVTAGGLEVDAAASGTFEAVFIEDTAAGSTVRGRFN